MQNAFDAAFSGQLPDHPEPLVEIDDPGEMPEPWAPRQTVDPDSGKFIDGGKRPPRADDKEPPRVLTYEELKGETLLNAKDAATFMGLKVSTLETWRRDKIGPNYYQKGEAAYGRVYYRVYDLLAYRDREYTYITSTE